MNPDLLERLRELMQERQSFAPTSTRTPATPATPPSHQRIKTEAEEGYYVAPNVRRLMTGPTADSAWAAAGSRPSLIGSRPWGPDVESSAGTYNQASGAMHLNPYVRPPGRNDLEQEWVDPMATYHSGGGVHGYTYRGDPQSPRMTLLHEAGHLRGPDESRADVFAQAFDYLSKTGRDTTGAGKRLEEIERLYPGTRQMVGEMIGKHPFVQHPLQPRPTGTAEVLRRLLTTGLR
jgi:hypothetical protein